MSRHGITPEQVFEAAQTLTDTARPVTVQSVREFVGGGSFSTISQHLRQWRSRLQGTAPTMPVPPEIEAAALKAITFVWTAASELAHREIETVRTAARRQLEETQAQTQEALQETVRLENTAYAQAAQIDALRPALAAAEASIAANLSKIEQLETRIAELKADLDKANILNEQRIEECGRLRGELAAYAAPAPSGAKKPARLPATPA